VRGTTTVCPEEKGGGWLTTGSSITRTTVPLRDPAAGDRQPPETMMDPVEGSRLSVADCPEFPSLLASFEGSPNASTPATRSIPAVTVVNPALGIVSLSIRSATQDASAC
jgi:hypothetical protein